MKLATNTAAIEVSGSKGSSSFSIAMNGKAFKVLSDTLYQNKPGSIVREISCNAYDAHVMAGKPDVPFEIHLPDNFEPWFAVKDFGVGLTPDAIETVFTKYFESTKDSSNDCIGAFGLGAKTPFSYTDQFTVTSIVNGKMWMYSAFIGASGVPEIALMHECDTLLGNGVEIKISVRSSDFSRFASEVKQQLKFFKVKPVIKNNTYGIEFDKEPEYYFDNGTVGIYKRDIYNKENVYVVQGNVGYAVNTSKLVGADMRPDALDLLNKIISRGYSIVIRVNIGDIGVTASREDIEYTADTIKGITNALDTIGNSLDSQLINKLDATTKEWDRAYILKEEPPFDSSIRNNYITGTLLSPYSNTPIYDLSTVRAKHDVDFYIGTRNNYRTHNTVLGNDSVRISPVRHSDDVIVLLWDTKKHRNVAKFHKFANDNKDKHIITIVPADYHDKVNWKAFKVDFTNACGGLDNFALASEIVMPKSNTPTRKSTVAQYYSKNMQDAGFTSAAFKREFDYVEDIDEPTVYIRFHRGEYETATQHRDEENVKRFMMISRMKNLPFDMPKLIAVREVTEAQAVKNENCTPLDQWLNGIVNQLEFDPKIKVAYNRIRLIHHVRHLSGINEGAFLNCNGRFGKMMNLLHAIKTYVDQQDSVDVNAYAAFFGWADTSAMKLAEKIGKIHEQELDKYPLLKAYFNNYGVRNEVPVAHIVEYVNRFV